MYHWVDRGRVVRSWPTLPANYRVGNVIYSRLPADHPNVRVGVPVPDPPTPTAPFETSSETFEYDEGNELVWEDVDITQVPLEDAKALARSLINEARIRRERPSLTVEVGEDTIPVDTRDERDFRNLIGLAIQATRRQLSGDPETFTFMAADNGMRTLTPAQVIEMTTKVAQEVEAIFVWSWGLKELVEIADSVDDIINLLRQEGVIS